MLCELWSSCEWFESVGRGLSSLSQTAAVDGHSVCSNPSLLQSAHSIQMICPLQVHPPPGGDTVVEFVVAQKIWLSWGDTGRIQHHFSPELVAHLS